MIEKERVYTRGNFLYAVDASGNETLESIGCDEGRIVVTYSSTGVPSYKDYWQVKDHLGSVRAVYDLSTTGTIDSKKKELSDYQPYGNRIACTYFYTVPTRRAIW